MTSIFPSIVMSPRDSKGQGRSCDAGERVLTDKDLIAGHGDRVDVEHRDAGGAQGALDGGRDPRPGERQVAGIEGERPRRRGERPQRREVERVQRRSARPAPPTSTASTATDRDTPDNTRLMRRPPSSIAPALSQLNVVEANFLGGGSQRKISSCGAPGLPVMRKGPLCDRGCREFRGHHT